MSKRCLLIGLLALALPSSAIGGASAVKVADDYFSPTTVKIRLGERVEWRWDEANVDSHRVILEQAPRGVNKKDFRSDLGATGVRFNPRFEKPGGYDFVCQIHPATMQTTVKVHRPGRG